MPRYEGQVQLLGHRVERQIEAGDDLPVTTLWWLTSQSAGPPIVRIPRARDPAPF